MNFDEQWQRDQEDLATGAHAGPLSAQDETKGDVTDLVKAVAQQRQAMKPKPGSLKQEGLLLERVALTAFLLLDIAGVPFGIWSKLGGGWYEPTALGLLAIIAYCIQANAVANRNLQRDFHANR